MLARYSKPPLLVAALRRSSRDIVDAERASCRAISRTPALRARSRAICSRSANDPAAHAKSIELEGHLPSETLLVRGDPTRLEQVFWNIVQNAVKFTPPGGQITLRAVAGRDSVTFTVEDTGPGIPAEMIPKLFIRYGQTEQAGGRRGTGLGLFVVKGIVEAHQGEISVHNSPGGGARFIFTLPRMPRDP